MQLVEDLEEHVLHGPPLSENKQKYHFNIYSHIICMLFYVILIISKGLIEGVKPLKIRSFICHRVLRPE